MRSVPPAPRGGGWRVRWLAALACAAVAGRLAAAAEEWPQFRGPTGQGHSAERGLPLEWSESRNVLWKVPVPGRGWSSPVVAGGRVWLTTATLARGRASLRALARVDLQTFEYTCLSREIPWNVEAIEVDPRSGRVAFTVSEDGGSRLYLLDGDSPRPLYLPLGIVSGIEFSPDGTELGFTLARPDARRPMTIRSGSRASRVVMGRALYRAPPRDDLARATSFSYPRPQRSAPSWP